jgi:hypothetical protein
MRLAQLVASISKETEAAYRIIVGNMKAGDHFEA